METASFIICATPGVEIRPAVGFPGYFASSDGRIYSRLQGAVMRELKPSAGGGADRDYLYVTLCGRRIGVHQVVAMTFLPEAEVVDGKLQDVVRHRDNNRKNNAAGNLLWGTQGQNLADRVAAGTMTWGERNGMTKLTAEQVAEIRRRRAAGERCRDVAKDFGISHSQAHRIGLGQRWGHQDGARAARQRRPRKDSHVGAVTRKG